MTYVIHPFDCRIALPLMVAPKSIHTCVTSPPYFGLRDYDHADQIGLEQTPNEYVAQLVAVFAAVRDVLRDDGTLWLNLGDSYARNARKGGSGPNGKHDSIPDYGRARKLLADNAKAGSSDGAVRRADRPGTRANGGLGDKQLLGIPWRVAFALQADGWYLRQDIIWSKPNPMPESVTDRCTKAHEYIFLLSKSPRYYFDAEAIKEPISNNAVTRARNNRADKGIVGAADLHGTGYGQSGNGGFPRADSETRNRRSVWNVTTKPYRGAHFATFPPDLIEPCILAGAPVGGTVLDPFGGSGTTAMVAERLGRNSVLCEINPTYIDLAHARVAAGR